MREAKLNYLATCDPAKAHPFYWSTLVLMGDEGPIAFGLPWYQRPWVWIAVACAVVIFFIRSMIRKLF